MAPLALKPFLCAASAHHSPWLPRFTWNGLRADTGCIIRWNASQLVHPLDSHPDAAQWWVGGRVGGLVGGVGGVADGDAAARG
jgi:hypothetical protein